MPLVRIGSVFGSISCVRIISSKVSSLQRQLAEFQLVVGDVQSEKPGGFRHLFLGGLVDEPF